MARALRSVLAKMKKESWRKKWNASERINLQCCCVQRECCTYDVVTRERFDITRTWSAYGEREERSAVRDIYRLYVCTYVHRSDGEFAKGCRRKEGKPRNKAVALVTPERACGIINARVLLVTHKKNVHVAETCGARIFFFFLWSLLMRKEVGEDVSAFERSGKTLI